MFGALAPPAPPSLLRGNVPLAPGTSAASVEPMASDGQFAVVSGHGEEERHHVVAVVRELCAVTPSEER